MDVQLYMFINGAWQEYNPKPAAHTHTWSEITGKPTTFNPSSHSHTWSSITGKPTTFNPSAHTHSISNITNLQSTLNNKLETETDPIFTAWNKSTGISITKSQVSDLIEATQSLSGLMSATDKQRLDVLHSLLEEDTANNVVDSINEVLAIFNNYPEGADLVTALAGKVDKVSGKGLSTNDYTTAEKNKLTGIAPGAEVNVQSDWNATSGDAFIKNKPTIITNSDITNAVSEHNDSEVAHPDIRNSLNAKLDKHVILGVGEYTNVDIVRTGVIQGQTGMPSITIDESNASITLGSQEGVSVNVANEPTANDHAATKKYVDDGLATKLETEEDPTVPAWAKTTPPGFVRFMRMNANNTLSWRTAADMRTDIGAASSANITTAVSNHNTDSNAHTDIREYVDSKTMKLINSGSTTALSETGYTTLIVPANSYAGKTVAVEIKYGNSSSTLYTSNVVYVTLGTSSSTAVSKSLPRFTTISEWDGEYFKHISVKIYVSSGTTSSINFGRVRTLIGRFTGSTIDWTTQENDDISVYIGKVWLVG